MHYQQDMTETGSMPLGRRVWSYFILSKPYSAMDNATRGVLAAYTAMGAAAGGRDVLRAAVLSVLMWLFFNWYSDSLQRNPGRIVPPVWLVVAPLTASAVIVGLARPSALVGLLIYVAFILAYPLKAMRRWAGPLGPVLRGFSASAQFAMVIWLFQPLFQLSRLQWLLIAVITLAQAARNLLGDIRDMKTDKFELPARSGALASYLAVLALLAVAIVVLAVPLGWPTEIYPFVLQFVATLALALWLGRRGVPAAAYILHMLFVLTLTVLQLNLAMRLGFPPAFVLPTALAAVAGLVTYPLLPRRSNAEVTNLRILGSRTKRGEGTQ